MSETPSAERHSRAKAIYGLAVFLLVTAHGLVLFLSWLIKAVRPDWPLRPLLSEEGVRWLFGHFTDKRNLSPLLFFSELVAHFTTRKTALWREIKVFQ